MPVAEEPWRCSVPLQGSERDADFRETVAYLQLPPSGGEVLELNIFELKKTEKYNSEQWITRLTGR